MSMTEPEIPMQNLLPLRAPDRGRYVDYPRLRSIPDFNLKQLRKRLIASLSLPEILPAHPEAPEPGLK